MLSAHRGALLAAAATAAACLAFAGAGLAGTSSISGTVANGGCDAARPVTVAGPSRIEAQISSMSTDNTVIAEILAPGGTVVANGAYDTPGGGDYAVRVCSLYTSHDPPQMEYTGMIGTGPAGQPVLQGPAQPTSVGAVLGAQRTVAQAASGRGAVMTRAGLAWFTVRSVASRATLHVYDPIHRVTRVIPGLHAAYGIGFVSLTGSGVKFVLARQSGHTLITYRSPRFAASGRVVRGSFKVPA
jgi:hypothetical protein